MITVTDKINRESDKRMEVILYPDQDGDLISFMKKQSFHNTVVLKFGLRELINKYGDGDLAKMLIQKGFNLSAKSSKEIKNISDKTINQTSDIEKVHTKRPSKKKTKKESDKQNNQNQTKEKHKILPQSVFDQWDNQNFDNL